MRAPILTAAVLLSLGSACGADAPKAAAPPAPATPAAPKAQAADTPRAADASGAPQVEYSYNPINKRDPFRGLFLDVRTTSSEDGEDRQVCSEPLCKFDLDELVVVAVVSGDANPIAMVEDRKRVGHLVRRNTKIGKQGGKVTQILRDCIVVTSFISGPDNKAQPVKTNMCVATDVRSAPPLDLLTGKATQ